MPDCEPIEMQQLRRMQELQQENEDLRAQLEGGESLIKSLDFKVAELEKKYRSLAAELEVANESERWHRREYDLLAAQMEIVQLIFGGNKCGGCG